MSSYPSNAFENDPNAVFPYGMPLLDQGLVMVQAIDGFGLVTRGLLWQAYEIWGPNGDEGLVTSWTDDPSGSVTTVWTADPSSSITTTWTADNSSELPWA